jgi:trk system potassium uptake protein TrkH
MNMGNRILSAFFQSVTPRTAGFNTVDTASLSEGSKLVTMLLMFIGAALGVQVVASRSRLSLSLWRL